MLQAILGRKQMFKCSLSGAEDSVGFFLGATKATFLLLSQQFSFYTRGSIQATIPILTLLFLHSATNSTGMI